MAAVLAQAVAAAWATAASALDWWNPQVWGIAGMPLGIPLALWAALVVDPQAAARRPGLGWMQDLSYVPAYLHSVFATLPVPLRWLPSPFGSPIGWAAPAVFLARGAAVWSCASPASEHHWRGQPLPEDKGRGERPWRGFAVASGQGR